MSVGPSLPCSVAWNVWQGVVCYGTRKPSGWPCPTKILRQAASRKSANNTAPHTTTTRTKTTTTTTTTTATTTTTPTTTTTTSTNTRNYNLFNHFGRHNNNAAHANLPAGRDLRDFYVRGAEARPDLFKNTFHCIWASRGRKWPKVVWKGARSRKAWPARAPTGGRFSDNHLKGKEGQKAWPVLRFMIGRLSSSLEV